MNSDPISDFLTRLRNASMVNKPTVEVPHSKFKLELSKLLKSEGYISDVKVEGENSTKKIVIDLKYDENGSPKASNGGNSVISIGLGGVALRPSKYLNHSVNSPSS